MTMPGRALLCVALVGRAAAQTVQVDGSGTTNPSKFFWEIMDGFRAMTTRDILLTYRAVGSSTGQKEFSQVSEGDYSGGLTDFGSGDIPMDKVRYDGMDGQGRGMVHVPFALGAIGIFHSVPVGEIGNDGLKLEPCTLAKIFTGTITEWDHPEITTQNPGMENLIPANTKIQVGHRVHGSSSTSGLTGYLYAATEDCRSDFQWMPGSTQTWPTLDNFNPVEGSGQMTDHIENTMYAIGYLDAGHGHQRGFSEVNLQNVAGTWLTSKDAIESGASPAENGIAAAGTAAVAANIIPSDATADWSTVNLYNQNGNNTWPIVLVSYIYLASDMSSWTHDKLSLLKSFVDYVTGDEGQALLADYSFNAIPAAMNTWATPATGVWDANIIKPGGYAEVFKFEPATAAWVGQGENVISSKRNRFSLWKVQELELNNEALEARVTALESHLDEFGIVPLHGSGTTNPRNWFAQVMKEMEHRARAPLLLTYRAVGSSTGQKEFVGRESSGYASYNHFGAGDIPMTESRYLEMKSKGIVMLHLPFALSAIGIFHSVPADKIGSNGALQLPTCILARIFNGDIEYWDDEQILDANPGMQVPANTRINVAHRTQGSSSTTGLSSYLNLKCQNDGWTLGAASELTWPTSVGFNAVEGSQGMQEFISTTPYAIGYLDAGHGHQFDMAEVALTNKAGKTRTSKESMALTPSGVEEAGTQGAANFPLSADLTWHEVNLYDMEGDNTWPIVLVSYLYVRKDQSMTNPKTAAALDAFLHQILQDKAGLAAEFLFTSPGAVVRTVALAGASEIIYPASMEKFTFETDTNAYDGMGANVISVKRTAFDDYQRDILFNEIEALKVQIAAEPKMIQMTEVKEEESDSDTVALVIAIIALVLAAIALIVGLFAFMKLSKGNSNTNGGGGGGGTIYGRHTDNQS